METKAVATLEISPELIEAIRQFPVVREVEHCGIHVDISPFDFYVLCPKCGTRIKTRSFSGTAEIEDVFDAVLEWLNNPVAQEIAQKRQEHLREDSDN